MDFEQQFPVREAAGVRQYKWTLDLDALTGSRGIGVPLDRARLEREVSEMQQGFPRWVLTVSRDGALARCGCGGVRVFDRGLRCVSCQRRTSVDRERLAWFGVMPPIGIDGLTAICAGLKREPPRNHIVGERAGLGAYLLVPLVATYPAEFPARPLEVHYLPEIRRVPGMPQAAASHEFHMLPGHQMCLFAGGEWQPYMTARETLEQRAYAHVIKLLNFCNGKRTAFASVS